MNVGQSIWRQEQNLMLWGSKSYQQVWDHSLSWQKWELIPCYELGAQKSVAKLQVWTWILVCRVLRQKLFWCSHPSNSGQNPIISVREFTCDYLLYLPQLSGKTFLLLSDGLLISFFHCYYDEKLFLLICLYAMSFLDWTLSLLETQNKRTLILSYMQLEICYCSWNQSWYNHAMLSSTKYSNSSSSAWFIPKLCCIIWGLKYCLNFVVFLYLGSISSN